ncbi:MAG: prepilin-type N-terminal cleavage/methylation domain-containing protein [Patescibacteria group bacterium]
MIETKNNKGFSLIEVLIYSAIFSLMLVGVLGGVYMIIQGANQSNARLVADDEANFVLRKINWVLTGTNSINVPGAGLSGSTLSVNKAGIILPIKVRLHLQNIELDSGTGTYVPLDTANVVAASLSFQHIPASGNKPPAVRAVFYLNDIFYETIRYLRK